MKIEILMNDGRKHEVECGTFTYREAAVQDGGPILLTLLKDPDRKSPTNEPMWVLSGVREFRNLDAVPIVPEPANG